MMCLPIDSSLAANIGGANLQHRVYENNENNHNRVYFDLQNDQGEPITENIVSNVRLFDPDNNEISFIEQNGDKIIFYDNYSNLYGRYDCTNGLWEYNTTFSNETYYVLKFLEALRNTGTYLLQVTLNNNDILSKNISINTEIIDVPIVSSDSFYIRETTNGDIIMTWNIPDSTSNLPSSSARVFLEIFNNDQFMLSELIVKVPTHMEYLFIPKETFDLFQNKLAELGNQLRLGVHIRTNDNHNRSYSNIIPYEEAETPNIDIDGDGKAGLQEAIYSLQVISGTR